VPTGHYQLSALVMDFGLRSAPCQTVGSEKMLRSAGNFVVATIQGLLEAADRSGQHREHAEEVCLILQTGIYGGGLECLFGIRPMSEHLI